MFKSVLAFFVLGFTTVLLAQQLGDQPGPQIIHPVKYTSESGNSIVLPNITVQTDEYGYFNNNAVLNLGSTGYASVSGAANENFDGTLEAWIYRTAATTSAPAIIAKGDASNVGVFFGISGSGGNVLFLRFGTTVIINSGGTVIPLNTWTHVAVTWAGTAGNHQVNFYVNGVQSGAVSAAFTGTWNITTDSLTIGLSKAFSSQFEGSIDEVRYWSTVRTLAQIRDNRFVCLGDLPNSNSSSALSSAALYTGLLDEWTFNSGSSFADPFSGLTAYYRATAVANYASPLGIPIPYNFILQCPFGTNDYVEVPSNAAFSLSSGGTAEAWIYPTGQTTTHMIMSRGTTGFEFFWGVRSSIGNKMVVNIGAGTQIANTDGVVIPLNAWSHVAITWVQNGGSYNVTFYVNGAQSGTVGSSTTTWTANSGTLRIGGWHGGTANHWNGWLDEVRIWNAVKTRDQIRSTMFASCRGLSSDVTGLAGAWNFDGSLLNFSPTAGINGTFSTGGTNNCRFSAFSNETATGAPGSSFESYITTVNHGGSPIPFPGGFAVGAPFKTISDNSTTYDTLNISGAGTVTSVQVLVAISHTYAGDLSLTLKAPNGTTRDLCSNNGGTGANMLTFFIDGAATVTNTAFLPPYSNNAGPEVTMGNFGGSPTNGAWVLSVNDNATGDAGVLRGWGIRLNNTLTGTNEITTIPGKFNLEQNFPNPFNPVTSIKFDVPKDGNVTLVIYDVLGKEVKSLVNTFTKAGSHEVTFDASGLASGAYFYRLTASDYTSVKKMVLVK